MVNMGTTSVLDMEEDITAKALALALPLLAVSLPTIYTTLPYFHGFWKVCWWLGDFRCTRVVVEGTGASVQRFSVHILHVLLAALYFRHKNVSRAYSES